MGGASEGQSWQEEMDQNAGCSLLFMASIVMPNFRDPEMKTFLPYLVFAISLNVAGAEQETLRASLERAVASHDPFAFADTALPRLSDLEAAQRAALAQRLSKWPTSERVAAW